LKLHTYRADLSDLAPICSEIIIAAEHGHFCLNPLQSNAIQWSHRNIYSVIEYGHFENGLSAIPIVFEFKNQPIGYVIMSEVAPGSGGNEIHIFIVPRAYQNQGYGTHMLTNIMKERKTVDVYARCAPASEQMFYMLQKRGFKYIEDNEEGFRILLRSKDKKKPRYK